MNLRYNSVGGNDLKKIMFVLVAILLLAGCSGSNEPKQAANENESENTMGDTLEAELEIDEEEDEAKETDDPLEAGNKNSGIKVFNDDWDFTYTIKDWYANENTDKDGFNNIDFDGYKVKFSIALLEDAEEKDVIGFFVETENNTDKNAQYNMDMEIITDEQEQAQSDDMYGIGDSKPGIKTKGFIKANLEYDVPESFKVTFEPPWDEDDEFNKAIGEPIELEFNKE